MPRPRSNGPAVATPAPTVVPATPARPRARPRASQATQPTAPPDPVQPAARPKVYADLTVKKLIGQKAMDADVAAKYLGLVTEDPQGESFGNDFLFMDLNGRRCRTLNNTHNRPLYQSNLLDLKQIILRRQFRLNGEPIIIGCYGGVLDGQHTMIALWLAQQELGGPDAEYWQAFWPEGRIVIDKVLIQGIDESDDVVNTINTGKRRTFGDIVYRSVYFADLGSSDRRKLAGLTEHAVRFLWYRTGAGLNAFAPRQTHRESESFVTRHPRLLEAVRHIWQEDGATGALKAYFSPGYASGLLYLMGTSGTDPEIYQASREPGEAHLDMSFWDLACAFWAGLAAGGPAFKEVHSTLVALLNGGAGRPERLTVLIKAWNRYAQDQPMRQRDLWPAFVEMDDGTRILQEFPSVGGIDLGDPDAMERNALMAAELGEPDVVPVNEDGEVDPDAGPVEEDAAVAGATRCYTPTPEEIAQRALVERQRRQAEATAQEQVRQERLAVSKERSRARKRRNTSDPQAAPTPEGPQATAERSRG